MRILPGIRRRFINSNSNDHLTRTSVLQCKRALNPIEIVPRLYGEAFGFRHLQLPGLPRIIGDLKHRSLRTVLENNPRLKVAADRQLLPIPDSGATTAARLTDIV